MPYVCQKKEKSKFDFFCKFNVFLKVAGFRRVCNFVVLIKYSLCNSLRLTASRAYNLVVLSPSLTYKTLAILIQKYLILPQVRDNRDRNTK